MNKEVKITLSNEKRKIELTEVVSDSEEYLLWQWKKNLIEPALKALTYSSDEEIKEIMETHFKG